MERGPDLLQNGLVKVFGDAIVFSLRSVTVSFLVVPAFLRGLENSSLKYSPPRSERGHLIQVLYGSTFLSFMVHGPLRYFFAILLIHKSHTVV